MRDIWTICRMKLSGIVHIKRGQLLKAVLTALLVLLFAGMAVFFEAGILFLLQESDMLRMFPLLLCIASAAFALIATVCMADGQLVSSQDHDLLASLPVSAMTVSMSRLLSLYCANAVYQLLILLPGGVLWAVFAHPEWQFYLIYPVLMLTAQLLPAAVGGVVGLLVLRVGTWFRSTRVISLILSAAGLLLYMAFFLFVDLEMLDWLHIGAQAERWILRCYPPADWFRAAVMHGSFLHAALFCAVSLLPAGIFAWIYARSYLRLYTLMTARRGGKRFSMTRQNGRSTLVSLIDREFRRYFSSNTYVLNTGFGLLLSVLMLVILKIKMPEEILLLMGLPFLKDVIGLILPFAVAMFVGTCVTTGASISIEGRNMWILRSLPVSARQIVAAKVLMNLLLGLPFIIVDSVLMLTIFPTDVAGAVLMFVTPALTLLFTALLGILVNLKFYRFDWKNEAQVVKQSLGAGLPGLASMAVCAAAVGVIVWQLTLGRIAGWVAWAYPALLLVLCIALVAVLYARADDMMRRMKL